MIFLSTTDDSILVNIESYMSRKNRVAILEEAYREVTGLFFNFKKGNLRWSVINGKKIEIIEKDKKKNKQSDYCIVAEIKDEIKDGLVVEFIEVRLKGGKRMTPLDFLDKFKDYFNNVDAGVFI